MAKRDDVEYHILSRIATEDMPVGAGTIHEDLEKRGFSLSETGVGRLLRLYRKSGCLERMGYQGHVLTERGRAHLNQLKAERALYSTLKGVLVNSNGEEGEQIIGILISRRAIECEAAYWAAINATDDDVKKIDSIIKMQYKGMESGDDYTRESRNFHRAILSAAKIPMLITLYDFIGISSQWQNFFIGTFKLYNTPLNLHHEEIYSAIRERDPQKAVAAMTNHMDSVIKNAKKLIPSLQ